jgi:NhaB family Na+:H+ antiporter
LVGLAGIIFLTEPMTHMFYDLGWLSHHPVNAVGSLVPEGH